MLGVENFRGTLIISAGRRTRRIRIKFIVNRPETMEFLSESWSSLGFLGFSIIIREESRAGSLGEGRKRVLPFPRKGNLISGWNGLYIYICDYRGGEKRGGGNQGTIFRSNFHGMGLSIVEFRAFLLALYLSAPRNTDRGFISVGMINR